MFYNKYIFDCGDTEKMIKEAMKPTARTHKYMVVSYRGPSFGVDNGDYDTWGEAFEHVYDAEKHAKELSQKYPSVEYYVARIQLSIKQAEPKFVVEIL